MSLCRVVDCTEEDPLQILRGRSLRRDDATEQVVAEIIDDVRTRGDAALLDSGRRFDSPNLESIEVTDREWHSAEVPPEHLAAIRTAHRRIAEFHAQQLGFLIGGWDRDMGGYIWKTTDGSLGQRCLPVASAGVYAPGGKANYPSSVLMNAVPAKIAGVHNVFVAVPARHDGSLHPAVLVAADEAGVSKVFKIGGAAAIAALALGTETVPMVDKIVGPGNRFVNEAKRQLWGQVGLDGYAGPSEVCVLADDKANAEWAAADWITQVEHSEDNAGFVITVSRAKAEEIMAAAERQIAAAPRAEIISEALRNEGIVFIAEDLDQAYEIVDAIAPEHLTLAVADPQRALGAIRNAGCILLSEYSPESAGDFAAGPSHTLPTASGARFASPVNVLDFLKLQSLIDLSRAQLEGLWPTIEAFSQMEGFPAHGRGACLRLES